MTTSTRQTNIFAAEDWKKLYTTFSEADFQSYDFETIRKVLVDYLRTYYAEDYNDFTESSEFIALVDLIAFTAQSLAFRTDLNARENFLETAERRDSVLKLVKQLSYQPNRNKPASGLLKVVSISTTETLLDTANVNLARQTIRWNDAGNSEWQSQWVIIMNAAFGSNQKFGRPYASKTINNILTEQYNLSVPNTILPVFSFAAPVLEANGSFEVVSASITTSDTIVEQEPGARGNFGIIYQNDGRGNESANSGFFVYFKQGQLQSLDFSIPDKIPNRVFSINTQNVNQDDVWMYELVNGNIGSAWTKTAAIAGSNAVYNSIARGIRTLYSVNTRVNDQIDLVFSDGTFADMPQGVYRSYFRVSNGQTYRIAPADINGIVLVIPYISKVGRLENLTITCNLQYTIANSSRRDLISEIKQKAPQNFYTQNRMVNGEDYNILGYTLYPDIVKVKAVNRFSSGISRLLDITDPTGKYTSTNLFASDGALYKNQTNNSFNFTFVSRNDITKVLETKVLDILNSNPTQHFYYAKFPKIALPDTSSASRWQRITDDLTTCTGFFTATNINNDGSYTFLQVGNYTSSNLRYVQANALVRFDAPLGSYFDASNTLVVGTPVQPTDRLSIWTTIRSVVGDGSNTIYLSGRINGGVTLSDNIPTEAIPAAVYPLYTTKISSGTRNSIVNRIFNKIDFAIRYDYTLVPNTSYDPWTIVDISSVDQTSPFDITTAGTTSDSSWLMLFKFDGVKYKVTYRGQDYYYNSSKNIRFINTNPAKVYDTRTNTLVQDNIKILQTNLKPNSSTKLDSDINWTIYSNAIESDGYTDNSKVLITFERSQTDGHIVNPEIFDNIVSSNTYVFFQQYIDYDNLIRYNQMATGTVNYIYNNQLAIYAQRNNYPVGTVFYASTENKFYTITSVNGTRNITDVSSSYRAYLGRQDLYFQYNHNASDSRRINPANTNLIDMYILSRAYDEAYRNYVYDLTGTVSKPAEISTIELATSYAGLFNYKMLTDELILNNGSYKLLFGTKSDTQFQATFQVVKTLTTTISDNEIKSMIIGYINDYFALANWDFGDTFYFSEMAAYIHSKMSGILSSIVIIPNNGSSAFGTLYEIRSQPNEIFLSCATVDNIDVVSGVLSGITSNGVNTIAAGSTSVGFGV